MGSPFPDGIQLPINTGLHFTLLHCIFNYGSVWVQYLPASEQNLVKHLSGATRWWIAFSLVKGGEVMDHGP